MMKLHVALLPSLIELDDLNEVTVVVVDVLRATTVMATALAAQAERVITCLEVADAFRLKQSLGGKALLGGERGGLPIEGFDFGNSPADYQTPRMVGATLIQTTTNGTLAIDRCQNAAKVVTAAFVNVGAVAQSIRNDPQVLIVCAGTNRQVTGEDALLAGALVDRCREIAAVELANDQSWLAADAWLATKTQVKKPEDLAQVLARTRGGRNLRRLGLESDVRDAAMLDRLQVVPVCVDRQQLTFVSS